MYQKRKIYLLSGIIFLIVLALVSNVNAVTYLNEGDQWQSSLAKSYWNSLVVGDIDNDGDLDLALTGCNSTTGGTTCNSYLSKIYINNGTSLIESSQWEQNLITVNYGSLAFGDIDNDGDLDLALSGCNNGGGRLSSCNSGGYNAKIYINNGTSLVENTQWEQNLSGIWNGGTNFGDVNNDGKLDLVVTGSTSSGRVSKVYINNGTSLVENTQWQSNINGIAEGENILGDIDNDGDLDLLVTGDEGNSDEITRVYINNGTSLVENTIWEQNLQALEWSSLALGDIDNDGDLDLTLIGHFSSDIHRIYRNNGSTFIEIQKEDQDLGGYYDGSQDFGDYDNDGYLDLITTGKEGHTSLYLYNISSNKFTKYTQDPESQVVDIEDGSNAIWADLDNDTDLDLIEIGFGGQTDNKEAYVYINNRSLTKSNTKPNSPNSSFSTSYVNNVLTLSWGNGSDVETNTSGLYYNLMVGNSSTNNTIVSGIYGGSSNPTAGYFGNMMQRKNITLNVQLESNKSYFWYVQTIDTGLAKSNWSAFQTFNSSLDVTKPNITIQSPSPAEGLHTTNPYFIFNATVADNINLTNVSLYADWTGAMAINETNLSGINSFYTFNKNLTNYNDGHYSWYIYACDATNNCNTAARSFYLDRAYPLVYLITPTNASTWTASNSVTFFYNVTDTDIASCSLIIDGAIDQTDTSIDEATTQTFTKTLANGNYNWNVNCTDYVNYVNSSETRSLTVSYSAPSGGGGGGGGTTTAAKSYSPTTAQMSEGYSESLATNDKISFSVSGTGHYLNVQKIDTILNYAQLTLSSNPIDFIIYINETKKFELTNDNYYDLYVKLNSIKAGKADVTIKNIQEYFEKPAEEEEALPSPEAEKEKAKEQGLGGRGKAILWLILWVIGAIVILGLIIFWLIKIKRRGKEISQEIRWIKDIIEDKIGYY